MAGTIYWTIIVNAVNGGSLAGYYVQDDAWLATNKSATSGVEFLKVAGESNPFKTDETYPDVDENGETNGIVLKDADGHPLVLDTDYMVDYTTGKVQFLPASTKNLSKVTIDYPTDCRGVARGEDSVRNVVNTAKIIYSDGTTTGDTKEVRKDFTSAVYKLDNKTGSYDYDTNTMTWNVGAEIANKENKKIVLNSTGTDFKLKDEAFKYITIDDIQLVSANWSNQNIQFQLKTLDKDNKVHIVDSSDHDYGYLDLDTTARTLDVLGGTLKEGSTTEYEYALHAIHLSYAIKNIDTNAATSPYKGMTVTSDNGVLKFKNEVDNDSSEDENKIKSIGEVSVENNRSKISKSVSTDGKNSGYYYESQTDRQTYNQPDAKTLTWTVNLTEDAGFAKGSEFTDTISSENNTEHKLPNPLNVTVRMRKKTGDWQPITSGITIKRESDAKFTITFDQDFTNYTYAEITYSTTAKVSDIHGTDNGSEKWQSAYDIFKNTSHYNSYATAQYQYTNENPTIVKTFDINVSKAWRDSNTSKRPDYILYRLWRRTVQENQADDANWTLLDSSYTEQSIPEDDNGTAYTFRANREQSYRYTWSGLPKNPEGNPYTEYEYKVTEIPIDGYTAAYTNQIVKYSANGQNVSITNSEGDSLKKYVLDKNGNRITNGRLSTSDLILDTISETHARNKEDNTSPNSYSGQYYLIGYEIEVERLSAIGLGDYTLTDTFDKPFELAYTLNSPEDYKYQPHIKFQDNSESYMSWTPYKYGNKNFVSAGDNDKNTVDFKNLNSSGLYIIRYYLRIPANELDTYLSNPDTPIKAVGNSITANMNDLTADSSVLISKEKSDHEDSSQISKDVANVMAADGSGYVADGGILRYQLIVNPEANKLAPVNQSTYDITDVLNIPEIEKAGVKYKVSADIVSVTAKEITLKENAQPDENGKYDVNDIDISPNPEQVTYSYVPGSNTISQSNVKNEYNFERTYYAPENARNNKFSVEKSSGKTFPSTDEIILKIIGTTSRATSFETDKLLGIEFQSSNVTWGICPNGTCTSSNETEINGVSIISHSVNEETGAYEIELKIKNFPENTNKITIGSGDYGFVNGVTDVKCTSATRYTENDSGELVITVPDSKALLFEYAYIIDSDAFSAENLPTTVTNEASIDTGNVSAWDKEDNTVFNVTKTSATNETNNNVPTLVKRDIHDYNLKIGADFYVAYYNGTKWVFSSNSAVKQTSSNEDAFKGDDKTQGVIHELTFNENDSSSVTADNTIPDGAEVIHVPHADSDSVTYTDSDGNTQTAYANQLGTYNLTLEAGKVYKFIEIPTQTGYLGTGTVTKELLNQYLNGQETSNPIFNNYIPAYYFVYGADSNTAYPANVERSDIQTVQKFGDFKIDNTKLVNVKAEKNGMVLILGITI